MTIDLYHAEHIQEMINGLKNKGYDTELAEFQILLNFAIELCQTSDDYRVESILEKLYEFLS